MTELLPTTEQIINLSQDNFVIDHKITLGGLIVILFYIPSTKDDIISLYKEYIKKLPHLPHCRFAKLDMTHIDPNKLWGEMTPYGFEIPSVAIYLNGSPYYRISHGQRALKGFFILL